ncbi:serine hydrolase domain-containing protein [Pedobacter insulae]|uniref:CubicO group peptidase, beta-lactamase class C family n=1 Tax=Pedobacter insulae TaxID=414048 RepID=A0A1I2UGT3_9SPHI|nr:serine hydrolase domain-containing protein [Pedobacter insulae]SFG73951.1 CubicO group peptidase, beta-lactamase class C family [Pedobacter insulae]
MLRKKIFTTLAILLASTLAFSQFTKTEAELQALVEKTNTVGLAVAVVKNGKIIYAHSFGAKDVGKNIPLSNGDIFRIASISKSFSATAIMQLAAAKKLTLADDFSKLVGFKVRNPKFPETIITLKMILSHTSSINDSEGYFNLDVINPEKGKNWEKCYNDYEPGKGYAYCNLNFNMVGAVIEKITGERFDSYIKNHVLNPLGLYGGYWVESLNPALFTTLYEYNASEKKFVPSPMAYAPRTEEINNYVMGYSTPIFSPTGGMKISATDLAKYMTMHMYYGKYDGKRIITKKYAKLMQTKISDKETYGLAITTTDKLINGKTLKGHTGSAYGLFSAMFFDPKEKFGMVVITNGTNGGYTDGFNNIIKSSFNVLYENLVK